MRLTVDGDSLVAEIVDTPNHQRFPTAEKQLYGKRVAGVCGTTFRPVRRSFVFQRRVWPAGTRRLIFHFRRDLSRGVKWCLVEGQSGADVSFVSFDPEPSRLVAKGPVPSGEWWRLSARRGGKMEASMPLRTGANRLSSAGCPSTTSASSRPRSG